MDIRTLARRVARDTRGANLVEYIMLVGLVALLCISAYSAFGDKVGDKIRAQGDAVTSINSAGAKK